jgi:hypothetical protein
MERGEAVMLDRSNRILKFLGDLTVEKREMKQLLELVTHRSSRTRTFSHLNKYRTNYYALRMLTLEHLRLSLRILSALANMSGPARDVKTRHAHNAQTGSRAKLARDTSN